MENVHTLPARRLGAAGREGNAMAELDAPQAAPLARVGTRKLIATVIVLALLPLVLPFPVALIALKWVLPAMVPEWLQCPTYCPPSTDGDRLEWLLILGPSLLVAVASILLGIIGIFRERWAPLSPKRRALFRASVALGAVWVVLLGRLYGVIFWISGLVP